MSDPLTLDQALAAVRDVDAWLDGDMAEAYQGQPLAHTWARVTKVCEEAGEVWRALSNWTGENPRKGVCGTRDELTGELADTASAAICAIQSLTKDTAETWAIMSAALAKAHGRALAAATHMPPVCPAGECDGRGAVWRDTCTCGAGPGSYAGMHEPFCGAEPCPAGCEFTHRRP